jgi:hypothetical protein
MFKVKLVVSFCYPKLTPHTLHLIFETDALLMVSLVAKPVEFGLSYNFGFMKL